MNVVSSINPSTNRKGNIIECFIDMQNLRIINLQNPVSAQDATPKFYVDNLFNYGTPTPILFPTFNFTLSGTIPTLIMSNLIGSFDFYISGPTGAPVGSFSIIKNDQTVQASITRHNSFCGISTKERLNITWNPNQGIYCFKDNINHDGTYTFQYRQS